MTDELDRQGKVVDALDSKTAVTHDRINDVNKNSQLRNLGTKRK